MNIVHPTATTCIAVSQSNWNLWFSKAAIFVDIHWWLVGEQILLLVSTEPFAAITWQEVILFDEMLGHDWHLAMQS